MKDTASIVSNAHLVESIKHNSAFEPFHHTIYACDSAGGLVKDISIYLYICETDSEKKTRQ